MPTKKAVPPAAPIDRVQDSFAKIKIASKALNEASDKLNDSAAKFSAALKPLSLGVSSWFEFDGNVDNENGYSWSQEIGYAKLSGKWGLAIRRTSHDWQRDEEVEDWPFAEAPRALRVKAASHIPDLLDKILTDVARTTEEVTTHSAKIDELTNVITQEVA